MSAKQPIKPSRRPVPTAPAGDAAPAGDGEDDFAALFEASQKQAPTVRKIAAGDLLSCRVIAIGQSSVFVAVGDKSEGTIDIAEFRDPASGEIRVSVGDEVQATVLDDGSRSGSAVLTRMLGRGGHAAAELQQAFELGVPVEGLVSGEVKGGYEVQIGSVRAFCPGSQIDLRRGGERAASSDYVGKRFPFRVTKVENEGRNVVVSRRELLVEEAAEQARQTWESIRVGAELDGTVRSIRDFGAFVDLGGVDGMVHISELAYTRVKHPSEVLEIGQKVRVQVLRVGEPDKDGRRQIALSMRALAEDPWRAVAKKMPPGSTVAGTVTRLEAYGAFVEVMPGVEGLVHISKITPDRRLNHARQALAAGQQIEVTVLSCDLVQRRLSLSMIEQLTREREAEAVVERREQEQALAQHSRPGSLGTLGDLLEAAKKK